RSGKIVHTAKRQRLNLFLKSASALLEIGTSVPCRVVLDRLRRFCHLLFITDLESALALGDTPDDLESSGLRRAARKEITLRRLWSGCRHETSSFSALRARRLPRRRTPASHKERQSVHARESNTNRSRAGERSCVYESVDWAGTANTRPIDSHASPAD